MDFTVVALSNTSIEHFPNNTLSEFTVLLPEQIRFPADKQVGVALRNVTIATELEENQPSPSYLKVHLSELEKQHSGLQSEKNLGIIPFSDKTRMLHHECMNPHYLPLGPAIQTLTIRITDQDDKNLRLQTAHATAVTLNIKTMNRKQFSIVCNSHASLDHYPNNRLDDFEIQLPEEIQVEAGKWEVAVSSVVVPSDVGLQRHFEEPYIKVDGREFKIDLGIYTSEKELVDDLRRILKASRNGRELELDTFNTLVDNGIIHQKYRRSKGQDVLVLMRRQTNNESVIHVVISQQLAVVLGDYASSERWQNRRNVELHSLNMISFQKKPDLSRAYIDSFLLYADIVKPSFVGNTKAPVLQIVPTPVMQDNQKRAALVYQPAKFIYQELAKSSFRSIKILARTLHGQPITYQNVYAKQKKMIVSLLFREKKTWK